MIASKAYSKGFSLFELVIVVILLAVILSFAIPQYIGIKNQAHNASVDAIAGSFSSAVGMVRRSMGVRREAKQQVKQNIC
ncbi:prepilin-type N-terminal cleavage/methylation domain-containing protein [Pseudoalteromonas sp. B193]